MTIGNRLAIITQALTQPMLGAAYTQAIATSGGTQPVSCSITGGALPPGLILNGPNCAITGTPSGGVGFSVTITVTDANGVMALQTYNGTLSRPTPANDSGVAGIATAQATASLKFARAQLNLVQNRLDRIHEDDNKDDCQGARDICVTFDNGMSIHQIDPLSSRDQSGQDAVSPKLDSPYSQHASDSDRTSFAQIISQQTPLRDSLAQNHSNSGATSSDNDVSVPIPADANTIKFSAIQEEKGHNTDLSASKLSKDTKNSYVTPLRISIWASGSLEVGRYASSPGTFGPQLDNRFSTSGAAVGADVQLWPGLKTGVAFGFGNDRTDIVGDGSHSSGMSKSVSLYASQRLFPGVFLDGLVGVDYMNFTAHRFSLGAGSWIDGQRNGSAQFGSVSLTDEQKWDKFKFAPFVRLSFLRANLDSYNENGDPNWALAFGKANFGSTDASVGAQIGYDMPMGWGVLTPTARLQYQRMFTSALNQSMTYQIDPTPVYTMPVTGSASWMIQGTLGLQASFADGMSAGVEGTNSMGEFGLKGIGLRGNVRYRF